MHQRLRVVAILLSVAVFSACTSYSPQAVTPPAPSGTLTPSTTTVSFNGSSNSPQTFTISETGYSGTFTAVSANTSVATVAETSSTSSSSSRVQSVRIEATTTATFSVTPIGGGGTTITVSDTLGHSVQIPVSVTGVTVTPESHTGVKSNV
jgi:hypothetical protein